MDLRELQPTGVVTRPETGFPDLIENLLIRTFFEPPVRERIGWTGVAYRPAPERAWTFKVKGRKGIYGLTFHGCEKRDAAWFLGIFNLQYFPALDETVLEAFSIEENIIRQEPSFEQSLRKDHDVASALKSLFIIGHIVLVCDAGEKYLGLSFWAPRRWREVRKNGLYITRGDGTIVEAVQPGGVDRNVPAFALSWPFFDKLVLTVGYHLGRSPLGVVLKTWKTPVWEMDERNRWRPLQGQETEEHLLTVVYGPGVRRGRKNRGLEWAMRFLPGQCAHDEKIAPEIKWAVTAGNKDSRKGNPQWWEAAAWRRGTTRSGFHALGIPYRPPLLIITGFLGSGKTTLLNQIVEYKTLLRNKFVAVIQNEVGPVDVDGKLVGDAFHVTTLEEGCICCTLLGELRGAVRKICLDYEPDLIIVETTGVADPRTILLEIPDVESFVRFDSLVAVVDGPNFQKALGEYPVIRSQIEFAHLVVLNKIDLMDEARCRDAKKMIKEINPRAAVFPAAHAGLPPGLLFLMEDDLGMMDMKENLAASGHLDMDSQKVQALSIALPGSIKERSLVRFLNGLPDSVYRLKGVITIEGREKPQLLQYVARRYEWSDFTAGQPEPNTLVFIGRNIDEKALKEDLARCLSATGLQTSAKRKSSRTR